MNIIMKNYVSGSDFGEVYRLFTDIDVNRMIIDKPDHNSMGTFTKWLESKLNGPFNDFMVFKTEDETFLGFAYSYEFKPLDGHCLFSLAVKPEYQRIGCGGAIAIKFLEYLFSTYALRKVYIHIYDYNEMSKKCIDGFGAQTEGILKDYHFWNGEYRDLLIYSITKEGFYEAIQRIKK